MLERFEDEVDRKITIGFLGLRSQCCVFEFHGHEKNIRHVRAQQRIQ